VGAFSVGDFSCGREIQGPGIRLPEPTCGLKALGERLAWPIGEGEFPSFLVPSLKCRWPFIMCISGQSMEKNKPIYNVPVQLTVKILTQDLYFSTLTASKSPAKPYKALLY
jgi:hypothetical protein